MQFYPRVQTFLLLLVALASILTVSAAAAPRIPALRAGMAYHEVILLWGTPQEKSERETRREDLWYYRQGEVLFREGVVIKWRSVEESVGALDIEARAPSKPKKTPAEIAEFDDLLNDIMRELPDDPSTAGSPASPTPLSAMTNPAAIAGLAPGPIADD